MPNGRINGNSHDVAEPARPVFVRLRRRAGMSQSRLAELVEINHSYVSRIESGAKRPDREVLCRVAAVICRTDEERYALLAEFGYLPGGGALRAALAELGRLQRPFLERLGHLNSEPDTLVRYATALMVEVAEFVNEVPWKSWKPGYVMDPAAVLDEWADVTAFLGTWVCLLEEMGITPAELASAYEAKRLRNQRRFDGQEPGYDGVPPATTPPVTLDELKFGRWE